ncbi:MAG: prepilin peptidase [Planctomycetota bacterium]|jgi:prepilin signal peptidase PulO-like enzyme (type II secretory pathway)
MPSNAYLTMWIAQIPILFFIFWFGACAGSFINVLVYRLPRGLGVVVPTSRCPSCDHKLTWKENIPILGWIVLGGKCRFCKARISPEYPLVEASVALLFAGVFMLWFMDPSPFEFIGINADAARPEWAYTSLKYVWPYFAAILFLLGGLVASTIIDARTFTIPIVIPWIVAGVGIAGHVASALLVQYSPMKQLFLAGEHIWAIPVHGWTWSLAAIGGGAGLILSNILLRARVIPLSFSDYEEWEKEALAKREAAKPRPEEPQEVQEPEPPSDHHDLGSIIVRVLILTLPAILGMWIGVAIGLKFSAWKLGLALGGGIGLIIGIVLRRFAPSPEPTEDDPIWLHYPYIRRELGKEVLFILPIVAGFAAGWLLDTRVLTHAALPPLWLEALGGSLLGMLAGGGIVWAVRIIFSYAFDMEAMGLGDVHLMAGVGAVLGWIDPLLAFFLAPLFGLLWAMCTPLLRTVVRRSPTALPYGPHLATATVVILLGKPGIEKLLSIIISRPIDLP